MRKILLFVVWICISGMATAQKIDVKEAREVARDFLGNKVTRGGINDLQLAYTEKSADGSDSDDVYIFNNGDNGGFVIVAGDRRASSVVIGHSDEGTFRSENMPDNMKWWLSEYARQIDYLRKNVAEVKQTRANVGMKAGFAVVKVAPLISSMWAQKAPFNNMAPMDGEYRSVTGCVATAMAQIMYFHKWPKAGKGSHTNRNDTKLKVDFSQSVYQWDKMRNTYYADTYSQEQADAVAKLMYDCGISVDMSYSAKGSGAHSEDVVNALTTYFDYSSTAQRIVRNMQTNWDDMMIAELEARRPIFYSGLDENGGGHAFVADGYAVDGRQVLFHINWGWGGSSNCYCLSSVMNPEDTSLEFKLNQDMIIGIQANNKVKSGAFYYNITSETTAQLTFANSDNEYSGDIKIPSSVNIEGKNYSVTSINASAFSGCTEITSINIPASIMSIGANVVTGCSNLKSITVNWLDNIPEVSISAFADEVLNKVALKVPVAMVDTYAAKKPWMLFATIKDSKGAVVEYSEWTPFESGRGLFTYSQFFSGEDSLDIIVRYSKADTDKCVIQFKNWINDIPLVFNYDKKTNRCQVPAQSTGYEVQYQYYDNDGKLVEVSNMVSVADVPTYYERPDYFDIYPSTFDPIRGLFSLNLAYFVPEGDLGIGAETCQMVGNYRSFGITISDVSDIVENADGSASQKFIVAGEKDVAKFKYAIVEGYVSDKSIKIIAQNIADGSIESKVWSVEMGNIINATYPKAGKYTFVVVSLDKDGNYYGEYDCKLVWHLPSKDWKYVSKGTFKYYLYFDGEIPDLTLSRNIADPSYWKISNAFYGVNFVFRWDENTDTLSFEPTYTGYLDKLNGNLFVANNHEFFDKYNEYYGIASRFDRNTDSFKFSFVYYIYLGYFTDCVGVETFTVPGLATAIQNPSVDSSFAEGQNSERAGLRSYNLNGQAIDESYKGVVIKDGKKYLKK